GFAAGATGLSEFSKGRISRADDGHEHVSASEHFDGRKTDRGDGEQIYFYARSGAGDKAGRSEASAADVATSHLAVELDAEWEIDYSAGRGCEAGGAGNRHRDGVVVGQGGGPESKRPVRSEVYGVSKVRRGGNCVFEFVE